MPKENVVKLWHGGIPTAPDVDRLMELEFKPGDAIGYGQVESVIREKRGSSRFRTVTDAWRKRLFRERSLQVVAEGGMFHGLTPSEALSYAIKDLNRVGRAARRTTVRAGVIDVHRLSREEQERHMLVRRHSAALLGHTQDVCKAIAPPAPVTKR